MREVFPDGTRVGDAPSSLVPPRPGQRPASRRGQLADKDVNLAKRKASAAAPSHGPSRASGINYMWRNNHLPRSLKLRLYAASVCSTLTQCSEAWTLRQLRWQRSMVSTPGNCTASPGGRIVRPSYGCAQHHIQR